MRRLPLLVALLAARLLSAEPPADPWDAWPAVRVSPPGGRYRPAALQEAIAGLAARHPGLVAVEEKALSAEGRPVVLLSAGSGPRRVLLWSQMHGDEPTATGALVDLLELLGRTRGSAATEDVLGRLTLLVVPMLNPDGAERNERRNAQGIDVNRDALRLVSPEGRFLKAVRDRFAPAVGFNLHNQSPLISAGASGRQAALSVLAVAADPEARQTEGRTLTMRLAVAAARRVSRHLPGQAARYDTEYTERAFGDSLGRWGTPVLLVETGGLHGPGGDDTLVRLNVAVLHDCLLALARDTVPSFDLSAYEAIPLNERDRIVDLVVRGGLLAGGRGLPPYLADLAVARPRSFAGDAPRRLRAAVTDVGDLSTVTGLEEVDATGLLVAPAPDGGPDAWKRAVAGLLARGLADEDGRLLLSPEALSREAAAWAAGRAVVPGYDGALLLLRPDGAGRLKVERTLAPPSQDARPASP